MPMYLIGDLQGCDAPLGRLLAAVDFSPSRDTLFLLGDLVNRGPESLAVLRRLSALGDAAHCLLGNHDLHLLAMWQGVRKPGRRDTSQEILSAADGPALLDWLRHRQMAMDAGGWLMVHAGVLPAWTRPQTLALAAEVEAALRGPDLHGFMREMYGNLPARWDDSLQGADRLRVIVNALTRLRFCTPDGLMEFEHSGSAEEAPAGYLPWFEVPSRATRETPVAFGHWSTLGKNSAGAPGLKHNTLALDTGCVWGGCLTAARLAGAGHSKTAFEIIAVACDEAQKPG
jgi:bis(5'-nucleosyl)-tetraphosphatase (symmetrical)